MRHKGSICKDWRVNLRARDRQKENANDCKNTDGCPWHRCSSVACFEDAVFLPRHPNFSFVATLSLLTVSPTARMSRLAANHNSTVFIHTAEIHSSVYLGIYGEILAKLRWDLGFYVSAIRQLEKYACHFNVCLRFAQQPVMLSQRILVWHKCVCFG